jgi:hypothetical protein
MVYPKTDMVARISVDAVRCRPPQVVTMNALDEHDRQIPDATTASCGCPIFEVKEGIYEIGHVIGCSAQFIDLYSCPDYGALYWNFHQCLAPDARPLEC